jgi:hypothetical protein
MKQVTQVFRTIHEPVVHFGVEDVRIADGGVLIVRTANMSTAYAPHAWNKAETFEDEEAEDE